MAYSPTPPSVISSVNSSTTSLGSNGVFTGTSEDVSQYASATVLVFANQSSATDGLSIQQSTDGTNWDATDAYTIPLTSAGNGKTFGVQITGKFLRVVYTNGATANSIFRLQTIYHYTAGPTSSVRPQDARTNDNDMQETLGYNMLFNGTTWDRALKGVQTSANSQSMVIASDQSILPVATSDATTTISIAANATSSGQITGMNNRSSATIQLTGTWVATVQVQIQVDGTNWINVTGNSSVINVGTGAYVSAGNIIANGVYQIDGAGLTGVRVITTAYTSGTIAGTVKVSSAVGMVSIEGTPIVAQNATWTVRQTATSTSSSMLMQKVLSAANTTPVSVKTSGGQIYGYHLVNNATTTRYVRIFNVASSPTMGTTSPMIVLPLPASGGAVLPINSVAFPFSTGFFYSITTGAADLDNTAGSANDVVGTIWYV